MTRELTQISQNVVPPWECDVMGHLNLEFYIAKAMEAVACTSLSLFGMSPVELRAANHKFALTRQHIRMHNELIVSAGFTFHVGVLDVDETNLTLYLEMRHTAQPAIAATFVNHLKFVQTDNNERRPLPKLLTERALEYKMELPDHAKPRGIPAGQCKIVDTLDSAQKHGLLNTVTNPVTEFHSDGNGFARPHYVTHAGSEGYIGMLSAAALDLRGIGQAAVELATFYGNTPRIGDIYTVRSAVSAVGTKTFNWCGWLFDLASGECLGGMEATQLLFDLQARKALAIPDNVQAGLQSLLRPGLTA
jgi:acyl-CoA thioester hydrolase